MYDCVIDPGYRRRFLAYDMMALFGERLVDRPFVDRISCIHSHVVRGLCTRRMQVDSARLKAPGFNP
jgi:hypothetical protein